MKNNTGDFAGMADFLALLRRDEPELFREEIPFSVHKVAGMEHGFRVSARPDGSFLVEASEFGAVRRGVGAALAGITGEEHSSLRTLGVMIDVSRNMVLREDFLMRWLRQLSLSGYNMLMLYTEDTYVLSGEPFWGYMRGRYPAEMIRRLDAYAKTLGIELVGCIQTLGHLEQVIRWHNAYGSVTDTRQVLLADEPRTYELIGKMLDFWSSALPGRRIHIGMDEAHDLGRGKFLDRFGYRNGFEIFNRHLNRVVELCRERGLSPMIWSDMYFRLGNERMEYYDPESAIPEDVLRTVPVGIQLVYWDYIHKESGIYQRMLERHREIGFPAMMASAIWSCMHLWYDHSMIGETLAPCLEGCRASGTDELLLCLWGDDGSYCDMGSAMAGLTAAAELVWGGKNAERRFNTLSCSSYAAHMAAAALHLPVIENTAEPVDLSHALLIWDDPLMGIVYDEYERQDANFALRLLERYDGILEQLEPHRTENSAGDFGHIIAAIKLLKAKVTLRRNLLEAFRSGDKNGLALLLSREIPDAEEALNEFELTFRRQWLRSALPYGLEVIQARNGALRSRLRELNERIREALAGSRSLFELDDMLPRNAPVHGICYYRNAAFGTTVN